MKASGLKPPMKIERPCSSSQPRPAIPPSPPKTSMNAMEHLWETHGRRLSEAGLRRGSDNSVVLTEDTDSFIIGDRVWVGGTKPGQIAYIGETQFAPGDWAGIVLDDPIGKNDGSVAGCRYFQCEPKRGIFSRLTRLTRYPLSGVDCSYSSVRTTSPQEKRGSLNKAISPSLNTSTSSLASISMKEQLRIGERVIISSGQGSKTGVLRYLGGTEFANGDWCGVELDEPLGKNDGTVEGKRYFECRPKYGLFAPVHKVSRSPSNKNKTCLVHRPTGAALNASLKRSGSKESLASISSIGSTATNISRTISTSRRTSLRTATPARKSLQEILKDKQQEVEVLKKERDLERDRMTKAASQADRAEQSLQALKQEYEKYRNENEKAVQEARNTVATLLEEKNQLNLQLEEERRKCEDLLFRFEEESINKDDIQVVNTLNESRVKELEQQLAEERERVIQLEKDSTKLFEAEEELARLRTELQVLTSQGKNDLQEIQGQHKTLEESNFLLQKELSEKTSILQKYVQQINELQESLSKKCEESSAHKQLELSHQRTSEETKKLLDEKCALFDIMQKEHEIECENWQKELRHLQENMERVQKQNEDEYNKLIQEFQKKVQEKDELVKQEIEKFKTENVKNATSHTEVVKELKNESEKKIKLVTEGFEAQLKANDETIQKLKDQLNEKMADCEKMVKQLTETQSIHKAKDESEKETLKQVEELKKKMELFGERCSLLLNEEDAVQSEIENELRKFYNEYANINGHQLDAASQAALNASKEAIHVKQLTDLDPEKFQLLKESVRSRYMSNLKLIKDIIAIIVRKDQRIETLEKNVTELKTIAMNKDGEIKILFDRTTEMQDALSLSEETKSNLESELRMHETNLEDMKRKLQRAEEKIAVFADEKHKSELDAANAISTSDDLSAQLNKYNEDLRQKEKELDEARDKEFKLSKSLEIVSAKFSKAEEELKKALSSIQQLESDKKKLAFELQTANQNIVQLTDEFKTKESQINANIESMSKKVSELDQMIKTANSTIENLRGENKQKEQEIENNKKEIEKLSSECLNKDQRFENTNAEANNLRENLRSKEGEIQKLQAELDKKKKDLQQLADDVKSKDEQLGKVSGEKQSLGESQSNLLKELESAKELIKRKEAEIAALNSSVKATAEGSDSLQNEIRSLHDKLRAEQEQRDMLLKEKSNVQEIEKATRSELSSLKQVLHDKDELIKKMENTMHEISVSKEKVFADMKKSTEDEMREKEEMLKKHVSVKKELEEKVAAVGKLAESKDAEINELRKRIEEFEKNVQLEKNQVLEELKRKGESVEIVTAEREKLQQEKSSLESLVKTYEEKLNSLVESVKVKDVESEKIAQSFVDKINSLNEQNGRIKDGQMALEKENKQLLSKLNEMTENLKLAQENMKNNSNGKTFPSQLNVQTGNDDLKKSDASAQIKTLQEENESSKMQIDFLNSVIVDMQRKNEKLKCKVEVLEMGIPANEADDYSRTTIDKMSTPPRMFCDICDQFDLHETEDCHRQDQDSFDDQQKPPKGEKKIPAPRPYCENCEEFGHDTRDCNDAETF